MLTVVDAANLTRDFESRDFLRDRGETRDADDERTLVELLVDQIEFADVIVLNKIAAAGPERAAAARRIVASLNPGARLIETDYCDGAARQRLRHRALRLRGAPARRPLWVKEMQGFADHVPETEEYGISSFVWRARAPVRPGAHPRGARPGRCPGVLRAKGWFWVATSPTTSSTTASPARSPTSSRWGAGGRRCRAATGRPSAEAQARIRAQLARALRRPRQELVFIGTGLDRQGDLRRPRRLPRPA